MIGGFGTGFWVLGSGSVSRSRDYGQTILFDYYQWDLVAGGIGRLVMLDQDFCKVKGLRTQNTGNRIKKAIYSAFCILYPAYCWAFAEVQVIT